MILKEGINELGLFLSDAQIDQFQLYYNLLTEWNRFMNLTAITVYEEVCTKHFLDSISLCKAIDCTQEYTVIDVGTGAGFPGIPIKIVKQDIEVTLLGDTAAGLTRYSGDSRQGRGLCKTRFVAGAV